MSEASESVIRKIEKCLALSKSSNEHEAAAALRQAHKLMEAYNVTPEALAGAKIGQAEAKTDAWSRPPAWEMRLISLLKVAFGCDAILRFGYQGVLTVVVYIGVKHQAQLAAYAHEVLRKQVDRARTKYTATLTGYSRGEKISSGDLFSRGYISNIQAQVSALAVPPDQAKAIFDVKTKLLGGEGKTYQPASHGGAAYDAYNAGAKAGSGASLHRPMAGAAEQLKLGN